MEVHEFYVAVLFFAFVLTGVIHLYYYLFIFSRFAFYKAPPRSGKKNPVSVIVCAKNEVNNLKKYLSSVLDQSYPDFEVIVVNDGSWDETGHYLDEIKKNYRQIKIVSIPEQDKYRHGKKFA